MKWTVLLASVVAAFCAFSTAPVMADDVSDVVRARANARAGGGTSGHDAYILKQSGGALSGTKAKARAKKKAAAKHRARKAAKKKAAAKRRAALAAKKKKTAKQKRAAERRAATQNESQDKSKETEDATATPSTAAVLTNQDVADDQADKVTKEDSSDVVATNDKDKTKDDDTTTEGPSVDNSAVSEDGATGECKRFIPEVGQTVTVDC